MKNLIQLVTALILTVFFQTTGYSQTEETSAISEKQEVVDAKADTKAELDSAPFIGTYFLSEADLQLEIIEEDNKLYLVSSFSKDILVPTNETTLRELTRGVDLELIANDNTALKFTQNGYETTIKRVVATTEK